MPVRGKREAVMILGMSVAAFTAFHTAISLIAIALGIPLLIAMFRSRFPAIINGAFLAFTIATSVTGFFFPIVAVGPPHIVGVISLIVLAAALYAFYALHLSGIWRGVYIGTAIFALYLNVFVLVAQIFAKIPFAHALAPTATEPPFLIAQAVTLVAFVTLGLLALRRPRIVVVG
jgi:hypothetical protein